MSKKENRYYAYDRKEHKFITVDGKLAEVNEDFKKEMIEMNSSYMIFVRKDDFERYSQTLFAFDAMGEEEE